MDCIKAQKLITPYLRGQLSDRELEGFLDHIETCPSCLDELEIYYSIYESLGDKRDDGDYNFKRKLTEKLTASRKDLTFRKAARRLALLGISLAVFFIVFELARNLERRIEYGADGLGQTETEAVLAEEDTLAGAAVSGPSSEHAEIAAAGADEPAG